MALFDLYKYLTVNAVKEAEAPLVDGGVIVTNPTIESFVNANYKPMTEGRTPSREIEEGEGLATTYEDVNAVIVKNIDIFTKEVVQEEKPTEPLDEYHYYKAYTYETDTKIIHSWEVAEKPIIDVTVIDEQTQYRDTNFLDTVEEERILRTYFVIDKEVINDPVPDVPDDYREEWYTKEEYTDYSGREIHKGFVYKPTEERRIGYLEVTKREFCITLNLLKGITYSQLMTLVESDENILMTWRECVKLLRGDVTLDLAGQQLGLTHEDINRIFQYIHGEITLNELKGEGNE